MVVCGCVFVCLIIDCIRVFYVYLFVWYLLAWDLGCDIEYYRRICKAKKLDEIRNVLVLVCVWRMIIECSVSMIIICRCRVICNYYSIMKPIAACFGLWIVFRTVSFFRTLNWVSDYAFFPDCKLIFGLHFDESIMTCLTCSSLNKICPFFLAREQFIEQISLFRLHVLDFASLWMQLQFSACYDNGHLSWILCHNLVTKFM